MKQLPYCGPTNSGPCSTKCSLHSYFCASVYEYELGALAVKEAHALQVSVKKVATKIYGFTKMKRVESTRTTDSYLRRTLSTNCCIHTVVPPDDEPRYD